MKKYLEILKKTKLFAGISEADLGAMLSCLDAHLKSYQKGETVLHRGESVRHLAVLVEGALHVQSDDYWGNRSIINRIGVGDMFGEAYAADGGEVMLSDVVAVEDSVVAFFDLTRLMTVCSSACEFHAQVIRNLFVIISAKNRALVRKLGHVTQRSTRDKLISYLSEQARLHESSVFAIPFNRQQLADYLSVDRSAMSAELCRMRDEGLLRFEKNRFELL